MIKIKLLELYQIMPSLNAIINKELPSRTAYKLSKLGLKLTEEYKFLNAKKQELADKYAKRDDKGRMVINNGIADIEKEFIEECNLRQNDLYNMEFEIDFNPISIGEIDKFYNEILKKEFSIEPIHLMNLEKFVVE
jgi:hypothetical protein